MFATLKLVLELVPALIVAIQAIEDAIPGQGEGEKKLAAIREIMEAAYSGVSGIWPVIAKVVGSLVTLFNSTGVFKK